MSGLYLSIRIPDRFQDRHFNGGSFVFADELRTHVRRETGYTLSFHALWVGDRPEHAFLVDEEAKCAYDARGRHPIDPEEIGKGSLHADIGHIAPISIRQMRYWAKSMDPYNARIDIGLFVRASFHDEG